MFVDLIQVLRCPLPHADGRLVAIATRTVDRHLIDGTLGCAECGAEYEVRDGAAWFHSRGATAAPAELAIDANDAGEVLRLAALLGVDDRGGRFLLDGGWSAMVPALRDVGTLEALVLEARAPGASSLRDCGDELPIAAGSLRGVVLARTSAGLAASAARALMPDGRLVAPAGTAVPDGVSVLARDERQWVATRDAGASTSGTVRLRRA